MFLDCRAPVNGLDASDNVKRAVDLMLRTECVSMDTRIDFHAQAPLHLHVSFRSQSICITNNETSYL